MRFLKPAVVGVFLVSVAVVAALRCESGGRGSSASSSSALEANGTIRITDLKATSLVISWDAPKSEAKPEELEYRVFSLSSAVTPTLEDALALGREHTVNWTPGILTLAVSDLTPSTHYWFAVFVQDPQKRLALYPVLDVTTAAGTPDETQGEEGNGEGNDDEGKDDETKTNLAPVAGTLSATPTSPTSVQLTWTKASDDQTAAEDLEYRVEVTQPATALKLDWTKGLAALVLADLAPETSYLITLSVRDASGLVTSYVPVTATTPARPRIALFSPLISGGGNLGGRIGADTFCETNKPLNLQCSRGLHAYLSVDASDTVLSMPTNFDVPTDEMIVNAAGTATVAENWNALTTTAADLLSSGVLPQGGSYWTGSASNGAYSGYSCQNWTVGVSLTEAVSGDDGSSDMGDGDPGDGSESGGDPNTSGGGSSGGPPIDFGSGRAASGETGDHACSVKTVRLVCVCF